MADKNKRLADNVPGEFFVDSTCINCDTCRQLAPEVFEDSGEFSFVQSQPKTAEQNHKALRALLCCPTGSIGTEHKNDAREVMQEFPIPLEDNVYYCGFNSPKSYGGNSYFVQRPEGNWLIDSPKFVPQLIKRFEELGGVKYIFLTHQDDVAEAEKFAARFSGLRIIHELDSSAQSSAEIILRDTEPITMDSDFLIIPTPGHTAGHCVLLYRNRFLFSGDHLWWSRHHRRLAASKRVCWYSWPKQTESMEKLLDFSFEWVLPGHGQRTKLGADLMHTKIGELVDWMKAA